MCERGCAATNTLTGGCSESGDPGDNSFSRPVPGLGSCPPRGLQKPVPGSVQAAFQLQRNKKATLSVTFWD